MASSPAAAGQGQGQDVVFIPATSPMFRYAPYRNGPVGSAWLQIDGGGSACAGPSTFAVEIDSLYFADLTWIWQSSADFTISAGLDGTLQSGPASSGGVSLSASIQTSHTVRLETACQTCSGSDNFQLLGATITTQLSTTGPCINFTLDDASSNIKYTGFDSTTSQNSNMAAIANGQFFQNTVSYTSTGGASATFNFQGSALYLFGPTGPSFGTFQIILDNTPLGIYNASTTYTTYNTLLFFTSHLDPSTSHNLIITNQVDGGMFALDYAIAAQPAAGGGRGAVATSTPLPVGVQSDSIDGVGPTASAVFPSSSPQANGGGGAGSAVGIICGVLGALLAIGLLLITWRYYAYKKAGGDGDCYTALCGGRRTRRVHREKDDFRVWPMIRYLPKYATK